MPQEYEGLFDLIEKDQNAKEFYSTLPDYMKEMMSQRSQNVRTEEELRDYAEMLSRGDH